MRPPCLPVILVGYQSHLVEALELAKRDVERAKLGANTTAKEEARSGGAGATGREIASFSAEEACRSSLDTCAESVGLQSSTVKYLRDKISVGQFHEDMISKIKRGGKVEETAVAKMARGMPEDKAWALIDAHRKWKREERLHRKHLRKSKHAEATLRRRPNSGEFSAEQREEDDT